MGAPEIGHARKSLIDLFLVDELPHFGKVLVRQINRPITGHVHLQRVLLSFKLPFYLHQSLPNFAIKLILVQLLQDVQLIQPLTIEQSMVLLLRASHSRI